MINIEKGQNLLYTLVVIKCMYDYKYVENFKLNYHQVGNIEIEIFNKNQQIYILSFFYLICFNIVNNIILKSDLELICQFFIL